jgi:preprotein translocase subunit YajC
MEDTMNEELKRGDKVTTIYGKIETVLEVNDCQVITYESARENNWYHISKVWKVK